MNTESGLNKKVWGINEVFVYTTNTNEQKPTY